MRKINRHYIIRKVLPACLLVIFVMTGLIKINIINTKSLSPLGNTGENYRLVSEEFGEDFSNFIKDNSWVKIYKEQGDDILVRMGNKDFKITNKSIFTKAVKGLGSKIENGFNGAKETIYDLSNKLKNSKEEY